MQYDELPALIKGEPVQENKGKWKEIVSGNNLSSGLTWNLGSGACEIWSNDLSEEYVDFNQERVMAKVEESKRKASILVEALPYVRCAADPFSWSSTGEVSWTRPIPK